MSSESKVILYLARHGETVGNIERILYSPDEDVLSEKGKKQASLLGKHVENVQFTRVYTSNYSRTIETASIVLGHQLSKGLGDGDIKQDERIRERHMGIFEGQSYQPLLTALIQSQQTVDQFHPEGGETFDDMKVRIMDFFQETLGEVLASKTTNETVLIVTHGYVINRFMTELKPSPSSPVFIVRGWEERCRKIMSNCSYMKLEVRKDEATGKPCLTFQEIHRNEHLGSDIAGRNDALLKLIASNPAAHVFNDCLQA